MIENPVDQLLWVVLKPRNAWRLGLLPGISIGQKRKSLARSQGGFVTKKSGFSWENGFGKSNVPTNLQPGFYGLLEEPNAASRFVSPKPDLGRLPIGQSNTYRLHRNKDRLGELD